MGRLSDTIKQAAPKRRKLAGLERRWLVNNVSVMVVLAALCVAAITLSLGAYYYSNVRSGLEAKAKTTTDFFSNYISQSYNEYYQSCGGCAATMPSAAGLCWASRHEHEPESKRKNPLCPCLIYAG